MMKCHAILTILSAWILLENTHCWSEASKGTCASADNPKKCTETVQNHLKNTVRTLWQEEIMPEQTKQLKDHFDKELAKLTNTISEIKAPLQVVFNAEKTDGELSFNGDITFDKVTLNQGNGMNGENGIFRAPMSGHYKFSFCANSGYEEGWTWKAKNAIVQVFKNGQHLLWITNSKAKDANLAYVWIQKLDKGDTVSFKVDSKSHLRADSFVPLNFNGELILMET